MEESHNSRCIVNPATPRIVKIVAVLLTNCLLDSATHATLGRVDAWAVRQSTTASFAWTYTTAMPAKMNSWLFAIGAVTSCASKSGPKVGRVISTGYLSKSFVL